MNRILMISLFLLLLLPGIAKAQADVVDSMNSETFWKNMEYKDYTRNNKIVVPDADVIIAVASNRISRPGDVRFMSEERSDKELSYFLVFVKNGRWHVWRTSLEAAIGGMKDANQDWVVYTEGFGKIFTTGIYRGLALADQHHVNVLYLDYPSYNTQKKMLGNYHFALSNAKRAGIDFVPLLDTVKRMRENGQMGNGRLSLFFHSMGNNAIREIVLQGHLGEINDKIWVDNLVLNSACVPERGHAAWVNKINFARQIYINYNPKDYTLAGANLISLTRQLGQGVIGDMSKKAVYINFYKQCKSNHSNFVSLLSHKPVLPGITAYYNTIFHGSTVSLDNTMAFSRCKNHVGYDIICNNAGQLKGITSQNTGTIAPGTHKDASMLSH